MIESNEGLVCHVAVPKTSALNGVSVDLMALGGTADEAIAALKEKFKEFNGGTLEDSEILVEKSERYRPSRVKNALGRTKSAHRG
jgi:hypothetical protein